MMMAKFVSPFLVGVSLLLLFLSTAVLATNDAEEDNGDPYAPKPPKKKDPFVLEHGVESYLHQWIATHQPKEVYLQTKLLYKSDQDGMRHDPARKRFRLETAREIPKGEHFFAARAEAFFCDRVFPPQRETTDFEKQLVQENLEISKLIEETRKMAVNDIMKDPQTGRPAMPYKIGRQILIIRLLHERFVRMAKYGIYAEYGPLVHMLLNISKVDQTSRIADAPEDPAPWIEEKENILHLVEDTPLEVVIKQRIQEEEEAWEQYGKRFLSETPLGKTINEGNATRAHWLWAAEMVDYMIRGTVWERGNGPLVGHVCIDPIMMLIPNHGNLTDMLYEMEDAEHKVDTKTKIDQSGGAIDSRYEKEEMEKKAEEHLKLRQQQREEKGRKEGRIVDRPGTISYKVGVDELREGENKRMHKVTYFSSHTLANNEMIQNSMQVALPEHKEFPPTIHHDSDQEVLEHPEFFLNRQLSIVVDGAEGECALFTIDWAKYPKDRVQRVENRDMKFPVYCSSPASAGLEMAVFRLLVADDTDYYPSRDPAQQWSTKTEVKLMKFWLEELNRGLKEFPERPYETLPIYKKKAANAERISTMLEAAGLSAAGSRYRFWLQHRLGVDMIKTPREKAVLQMRELQRLQVEELREHVRRAYNGQRRKHKREKWELEKDAREAERNEKLRAQGLKPMADVQKPSDGGDSGRPPPPPEPPVDDGGDL